MEDVIAVSSRKHDHQHKSEEEKMSNGPERVSRLQERHTMASPRWNPASMARSAVAAILVVSGLVSRPWPKRSQKQNGWQRRRGGEGEIVLEGEGKPPTSGLEVN